jgi:hypothetical protein
VEILFLLPVIVVAAGLLLLLVLAAVSHQELSGKQRDSGQFTVSQADATGLFLLGADSLPHQDSTTTSDHSHHASHVDHHVGSYDSGFHGSHYDAGSGFGHDAGGGSFDGGHH